jgi:hypothetical protein
MSTRSHPAATGIPIATIPAARPAQNNAAETAASSTRISATRVSSASGITAARVPGFPSLEYYFLYPHLEEGALLILDDIHIPSVYSLFEFLRKDVMFELHDVVRTTAFFRRTGAPTFDPLGDHWWEQNYNSRRVLRYGWKEKLYELIPPPVRRSLRRRIAFASAACSVEIVSPRSGEPVGKVGLVEGLAVMPEGSHLWLLVHRKDVDGWWPQGDGAVQIVGRGWKTPVSYGEPHDVGHSFEIVAVVVGQPSHELWEDWVAEVKRTGSASPVALPRAEFIQAAAYRTVKKTGS